MPLNRPKGSNIEDNSIESSDIKDGTIVNTDLSASAQVVFSKMETLASNKIVITNESGIINASNASLSEIAFSNSPVLTGIPTAPTANQNTNTTQIATTAFVQSLMSQVNSGNYTPVLAGNGLIKTENTLSIDETIAATKSYVNSEINNQISWSGQLSGEIYVDKRFAGTSNGTIHKPYKSIQSAIEAGYASGLNDVTIIIKSGNSYTENLNINRNTYGPSNQTLIHMAIIGLQGVNDSSSIVIHGTVTIAGSLTTRVRFQNVQFSPQSGNTNAVTIDGTLGRILFQNCSINGKMIVSGSWQNWIDIRQGSLNGLEVGGSPTATASLSVTDALITAQVIQNAGIVLMNNCGRLYGVTHSAGYLNIIRSVFSTTGLQSTASSGWLGLLDVSFFNGQAYTTLSKTGACPYVFNNVMRSGSESISGFRFKYGASSDDFQYRPANASHFGNASELSVKLALDHLGSGVSTSDRALKLDTEELNESEIRAAKRIKKMIKKYRMINDPTNKLHIGVIAQEVEDALLEENLNPNHYAFLQKQIIVENDQEIVRYAIHYPELLAFVISSL